MCITFILSCGLHSNLIKYAALAQHAMYNWNEHARPLAGLSEELKVLILEFFKVDAFFEEISEDRSSLDTPGTLQHRLPKNTAFSPGTVALIPNLPPLPEHPRERHNQGYFPDDPYAIHYAVRHDSYLATKDLCDQGFGVQHEQGLSQHKAQYPDEERRNL